MKFGLKWVLLVLLTVFLFVPLVKVAAGKVRLPESVTAWIMSV